jgi:hypothetical protein
MPLSCLFMQPVPGACSQPPVVLAVRHYGIEFLQSRDWCRLAAAARHAGPVLVQFERIAVCVL